MLRHCSLWKFTSDAPADLGEQITAAYRAAAPQIPSVRACAIGPNIGYLPENFDFALTLDFDDLDGYRAYVEHALHLELYRELLEPHLRQRVGVQFELRQ